MYHSVQLYCIVAYMIYTSCSICIPQAIQLTAFPSNHLLDWRSFVMYSKQLDCRSIKYAQYLADEFYGRKEMSLTTSSTPHSAGHLLHTSHIPPSVGHYDISDLWYAGDPIDAG